MGNLREQESWDMGPDETTIPSSHTKGFSIFAMGSEQGLPEPPASALSGNRPCSGGRIPTPLEPRHHSDPLAGMKKLPPKLRLDNEAHRTTHLEIGIASQLRERFSLADALHAPQTRLLAPIEAKAGTVEITHPLPPLTPDFLEQLIHWYHERVAKTTPPSDSKIPVWFKHEGQWVNSGKSWADVAKALAKGTHGVEERFPTISSFIQSRKPPLTPEHLKDLLKWTSEKIGSKVIRLDTPLWTKEQSPAGAPVWKESFYRTNEIDVFIKKPGNREVFKAKGFTDFKAQLGYLSGKDAVLGVLMNEFNIQDANIPKVTLADEIGEAEMLQLSGWHEEREGYAPSHDAKTPVWVKQDDGSWARATATWPQLFKPLLDQIAELKTRVAASQERHAQLLKDGQQGLRLN